jgi:hypothetical protein
MPLQDNRVQLIACFPSLMRCLAAYIYMREKVLLCRSALIVEADDPVWLHWQVCDNKADAWEQFAGMPLDLGGDTTGFVPGCRLILEVAVDALHAFWRTTHRALEQMRNSALKYTVGAQANGIVISFRFQSFV